MENNISPAMTSFLDLLDNLKTLPTELVEHIVFELSVELQERDQARGGRS